MKLSELVDDYASARAVGLMLTASELTDCALRATRFYAGYGDIASLSNVDNQPAAGELPADPPAVLTEAYPVKDLAAIVADTELTVGEWAVISPLFYLYVELLNATRLEASRAAGVEPFGRSSSEIQQEIVNMETEALPQKCFSSAIITIE